MVTFLQFVTQIYVVFRLIYQSQSRSYLKFKKVMLKLHRWRRDGNLSFKKLRFFLAFFCRFNFWSVAKFSAVTFFIHNLSNRAEFRPLGNTAGRKQSEILPRTMKTMVVMAFIERDGGCDGGPSVPAAGRCQPTSRQLLQQHRCSSTSGRSLSHYLCTVKFSYYVSFLRYFSLSSKL